MQLDHVFRRLDLSKLSLNERDRYIVNIAKVADVIEARFTHVTRPEQIKLKHCQYYRNTWLPAHTTSERTKKEHMRALRLLVMALGRDESWLGALNIRQTNGKGGRPSKVGVKRSRKYYR
ncbi:hypothetical protein O4H29_01835 [Marinobacter salarius]|jgi:hypothetical protein|uniref:phage integrase N-terminal domain-containing protein n=1 Tax=Marinobacter salarius TaxID=1420917 RepID=UPI0022AEBABB|nr:phage integrase N-terminal domain-containing protein [Marinobacter salarius]MCZ4283556.1 hypothetical protein [Marinobacter salarius]